MIKSFALVPVLMLGLLAGSVSADPLKNSLSDMIKKKDTSPGGMVDLDSIGLKKVKPASRPGKAVVGTINGKKVLKKEADAHLKKRTNGKISDFDLLPKDQRLNLIKDMALPIIISQGYNKELSDKEKEVAFTRIWMQKKIKTTNVSDEELKQSYDEMKYMTLQKYGPTKEIPPFEAVKENIHRKIIEQKIIGVLMQDVNVTISGKGAGRINGKVVTIEEANQALQAITKSDKTWEQITESDKKQLLQMLAPKLLVADAAKKELTKKEKKVALTNYWMQGKIAKIEVSGEEAKKVYDKMKKASKKAKKKEEFPEFEAAEQSIKMRIAQEKAIAELIKKAKIKLK